MVASVSTSHHTGAHTYVELSRNQHRVDSYWGEIRAQPLLETTNSARDQRDRADRFMYYTMHEVGAEQSMCSA